MHYGNEVVDINGLIRLIDRERPKCLCGAALLGRNIDYRKPHKDGVNVKGIIGRRWIYVHCDNCGYNMSLWKISRKLMKEKG